MATTVFGTTIAVFPDMTPLLESLRLLDSQAFEQCFHRWVESITLAIGAKRDTYRWENSTSII